MIRTGRAGQACALAPRENTAVATSAAEPSTKERRPVRRSFRMLSLRVGFQHGNADRWPIKALPVKPGKPGEIGHFGVKYGSAFGCQCIPEIEKKEYPPCRKS